MKKNPTVRLSCTVSKQLDLYIRWLLAGGLHGNTKSEVVGRLLCEGIRQAVPVEVIRKFTASIVNGQDSPPQQPEQPCPDCGVQPVAGARHFSGCKSHPGEPVPHPTAEPK